MCVQKYSLILKNLKSVKEAFVSPGTGKFHFIKDLEEIKPDIFVVNEDGHSEEKKEICESRNIDYKILKRIPDKTFDIVFAEPPYNLKIGKNCTLDCTNKSKSYEQNLFTFNYFRDPFFNDRLVSATRFSSRKRRGSHQ